MSTAGLKYELRWLGWGDAHSSTEEASVTVACDCRLLVLASLSSPEVMLDLADDADETFRARLYMRWVPAMSGASYESMLVVEIRATGREISDRLIGLLSGDLWLAARPMYGAGMLMDWLSWRLRLVVKARASDMLMMIVVLRSVVFVDLVVRRQVISQRSGVESHK